jgi:hypothetical protein
MEGECEGEALMMSMAVRVTSGHNGIGRACGQLPLWPVERREADRRLARLARQR